MNIKNEICIVGLGYVGLPLSICFSKKYSVIGFDVNKERVKELKAGIDSTSECNDIPNNILFTDKLSDCKTAEIYIITVPTPVDDNFKPDLNPLIKASEAISKVLKKGDFVIYESTVFPGVTDDICIPILEKKSDLNVNEGFFVGYSPERVVPGSGINISEIKKVVSGSNEFAAKKIESLYASIIKAGVFLANSIKVAEAAKVIENTQRDVNIALVNELSIIFNELDINTNDVLDAANTKWNFTKYTPGLVGGHCIGVDPYYLSYKAVESGINPKLIIAAREINEGVPNFVSKKLIKDLQENDKNIKEAEILILGYTFKENCSDERNTKVKPLKNILKEYGANVDIFDPYISKEEFLKENPLESNSDKKLYDCVVLAVSHKEFLNFDREQITKILKDRGMVYDLKSILPKDQADFQL